MIFKVGASRTLAALLFVSRALSLPLLYTRSGSKEAPKLAPQGKQAALMPLT